MAAAEPYILCELGATAYAIPSHAVQRMEMVEHITPVPNAPPFVDGIVFSRGQVVPAVNLRLRFGFERAPYDMKTRLVVVSHSDRVVGLIVDAAREFVAIPKDAIHSPPEGLAGTSGNYLGGVATIGGKVVLILDLSELLNHTGNPLPITPDPATR